MNKKNKIVTLVFFSLLCLYFAFFIYLVSFAQAPAPAPAPTPTPAPSQPLMLNLQKPFGTLPSQLPISETTIGNYIKAIYAFASAVVVAMAIIAIIIGGVQWILSGGSSDKIGKAKDTIFKALIGLMIAIFAVFILQIVSPGTVNFKSIGVQPIQPTPPCCQVGAVYKLGQSGQGCKDVGGTPTDDYHCGGASTGFAAGSACYKDTECAAELYCKGAIVAVGTTGQGTCTTKKAAGEICLQNSECASGWCPMGGGTSSQSGAYLGLFCHEKLASGDTCVADSNCASGSCSLLTLSCR